MSRGSKKSNGKNEISQGISADYGNHVGKLIELARKLSNWAEVNRRYLLASATVFFIFGTTYSIMLLDISVAEIRYWPIATMMIGIIPLSVLYSAINLRVMADASGADMPLSLALKTSVFAALAESLPIPGGAIVRSVSLTRAGSTLGASVELVVAFAVLWIGCAALGAAFALRSLGLASMLIGLGATSAIIATTLWITLQYSMRIAIVALTLRFLGLVLVSVRVGLVFIALGLAFDWIDTLAFTFAIVTGSAAAIIPAGIGISEGISAGLASLVSVAPAGAFLAVAISRAMGLAFNVAAAAVISLSTSSDSVGKGETK